MYSYVKIFLERRIQLRGVWIVKCTVYMKKNVFKHK